MRFGFKAHLPDLNRRSNFGTPTGSKGWGSGPAQARQIDRRRCLFRVIFANQDAPAATGGQHQIAADRGTNEVQLPLDPNERE